MRLARLANKRELVMKQVNIFDAKTELSKLIKMLESKEEDRIVIARNGVPIAQLMLYEQKKSAIKLGIGKGILPDIDWNALLDSEENDVENLINWESLDEDFS